MSFGFLTALGVTAGVGLGNKIFGGGGPRAPRMNRAQKGLIKSQAKINEAIAHRIKHGSTGVKRCCNNFFGRLFGGGCGCLGSRAINGGGGGNFFSRMWDNLFGGGGGVHLHHHHHGSQGGGVNIFT